MWWTVTSSKTKLRVGRLVKAHGLKGALKLELYTDSPDQRFRAGQELELQVPETSEWFGKTVKVAELRFYNQSPVLFLEGIQDRSQAETLVKAILLIETDLEQLPEDPEAWYDHQLVGLTALVGKEVVGKVIRVDHLPAQDLLAIETSNGEVLVPFVKQIVPSVDIQKGQVVLTPPAGLFEINLPGGDSDEN
ncbi:MAG: ribosome maturation factor RimM [Actinobacteria bacterium]|nr:ribosome maturation factor RimM [Rhodoluna sp.]MSX42212.1 ribosome maturation factor RimM [Actinomycetota bacterium]MSZ16851.1 ribosome maturation factor RimM [Actinomycetota bacterium]MTA83455.1 ribosome maturation factor RimM [Actinomycetota bacterium]